MIWKAFIWFRKNSSFQKSKKNNLSILLGLWQKHKSKIKEQSIVIKREVVSLQDSKPMKVNIHQHKSTSNVISKTNGKYPSAKSRTYRSLSADDWPTATEKNSR